MTRSELLNRLNAITSLTSEVRPAKALDTLIDDIQDEGILDVQCPPDIAITMNLPRPA